MLGIVSTFFDTPHHPSERELRLMDLLARQTADYLERKHAERIQKTLIGEIQHRSNNLLAIIQAIAHRSLSGEGSLSEAGKAFEARLQALARANRELIKSNWSGVNLKEIVRLELEPFAERTLVEGTDVKVSSRWRRISRLPCTSLQPTQPNMAHYRTGTEKLKFLGRSCAKARATG